MMKTFARPAPRAARTRQALLAAGFDLLAQRPIDAIPIDDVVAKAGVAKGSFFNHFADKADFATAVAAEVRAEMERRVGEANGDVRDPLARLVGGMRVAIEFALTDRKQAIVMLRGLEWSTARSHPLNSGILADIDAAVDKDVIRSEAANVGVLYWLALCQMTMINVIERRMSRIEASERMREVLLLALAGLGVAHEKACELADDAKFRMLKDPRKLP